MMSFADFLEFNRSVSSEMFFSLITVLHEQLPCSMNVFRLKKQFRNKMALGITGGGNGSGRKGSQSPARSIASPSMVKGLSKFKKDPLGLGVDTLSPMTPSSSTMSKGKKHLDIEKLK